MLFLDGQVYALGLPKAAKNRIEAKLIDESKIFLSFRFESHYGLPFHGSPEEIQKSGLIYLNFFLAHGYIKECKEGYCPTEKLYPYSKIELTDFYGYVGIINFAQYKLKTIDKVNLAKQGDYDVYRVAFSHYAEFLFPELPRRNLGPFKGFCTLVFDRFKEQWLENFWEWEIIKADKIFMGFAQLLKESSDGSSASKNGIRK
jgi:hypothetical protein